MTVAARCLKNLAHGVKYIALRCAFTNVDLDAAKSWGCAWCAFRPTTEAVAVHAIGMMMSLNRRIHRAYQRTRR